MLGNGDITLDVARIALNKLEIDELGLDETDRKVLKTMIEKYKRRTSRTRDNCSHNRRRNRDNRRRV